MFVYEPPFYSVVRFQLTEESLGQTQKTDLDPGLEELLNRADATKTWTDRIVSQTEVLLQPNPGETRVARSEDKVRSVRSERGRKLL